jgi:hypothetical protein
MAIKTVTSEDVMAGVIGRTDSASLTTADAVTAKVQKRAAVAAPSPIVGSGEETVSTDPQPIVDPADVGKTKGVQERINELTRLRKEAEEFAEDEYNTRLRAERRVGELEAEIARGKPAAAPVVEEELKRPSPKDFTEQDAYDAAMEAYELKREEKLTAKIRREEADRQAMAAANEQLRVRMEVAKAALPDFTQVIEEADRTQVYVPEHVKAAIVESDVGPQLAYHLAKHPEEQRRIFALTPARALLELGKIELKYTAAEPKGKQPTTVETTRAPAPVTSISRSGDGAVLTDPAAAPDFASYKAARLAQRRRGR